MGSKYYYSVQWYNSELIFRIVNPVVNIVKDSWILILCFCICIRCSSRISISRFFVDYWQMSARRMGTTRLILHIGGIGNVLMEVNLCSSPSISLCNDNNNFINPLSTNREFICILLRTIFVCWQSIYFQGIRKSRHSLRRWCWYWILLYGRRTSESRIGWNLSGDYSAKVMNSVLQFSSKVSHFLTAATRDRFKNSTSIHGISVVYKSIMSRIVTVLL